jgi:uncharacterized protein YlxP (DUF503 family)|tara:strand:+ start:1331 stop:1567 length:237 start_codon:yes stop_codon:yes gene_type:complete
MGFINLLKKILRWVIQQLKKRYKVTVSFNKEYGDSDDTTHITKKIIVQKENHLKFRNEAGKEIEYRSSGGLNYIIEEL